MRASAHAATSAVIVLVIACGVAGADPIPPLVAIDVRDYASVARGAMDVAVARAQAIFDAVDVPVRLTVERLSGSAEGELPSRPPSAVTVLVYPSPRDREVTIDPSTLGAAPGAAAHGRIAYVFASRIEVKARRDGVDYGTLLGVVIAHEVGHVLLRGRPHSQVGVMRGMCDAKQIRQALLGTLAFTSEEASVIRDSRF